MKIIRTFHMKMGDKNVHCIVMHDNIVVNNVLTYL